MKTRDCFDLMPLSIHRRQLASRVLANYTIAAVTLSVLLGAICVSRWHDRQCSQASLDILMQTAIPVRDNRIQALKLQQSNEQLSKMIAAVQTARPRDSVLQSLAAVVESVSDFGLRTRHFHLRLATERVAGDTETATASMRLTVETADDSVAVNAHDAIADEDRFCNTQTVGLTKIGDVTHAELVATPRSEVMLP